MQISYTIVLNDGSRYEHWTNVDDDIKNIEDIKYQCLKDAYNDKIWIELNNFRYVRRKIWKN